VLFVHGYNESAKTAWGVMQSIVDGLGDAVTLVGFLWNSDGSIFDYEQDRKKAEESAGDLMNALIDLDCPHAVCHSMGNYLLQKAFELVNGATAPYVDKLAMVAADVDFDVLKTSNIAQVSGEILVMYCPADVALESSGILHGRARLGAIGPIWARVPNVQAVDCSSILPAELLDPVKTHGDYFKAPKCWDVIWRFFSESQGAAA
jgi:esterase/lipase superfamily enzyme